MISSWSDLPYAILLLGLILLPGQQTALRKQNRKICSGFFFERSISLFSLLGFALWSLCSLDLLFGAEICSLDLLFGAEISLGGSC